MLHEVRERQELLLTDVAFVIPFPGEVCLDVNFERVPRGEPLDAVLALEGLASSVGVAVLLETKFAAEPSGAVGALHRLGQVMLAVLTQQSRQSEPLRARIALVPV